MQGGGGAGEGVQSEFCFGLLLLCCPAPLQDLSRALISPSMKKTFPFEWTDLVVKQLLTQQKY